MAILVCGVSGCFGAGEPLVIRDGPASPAPPLGDGGLYAAAAEVDLTPPPGLPMYGYSMGGAAAAEGYWLRLHGRIIVLQYQATRVALVQLDLGASSGLLHRELAGLLADAGIDPPRLLMAATHTHGGPGGFFGDRFYNHLVAGRPAFDANLVTFFATRVAAGVRDAISRLRPARLGVWKEPVAKAAASNRSREAWLENFADGRPVPEDEVDRALTLIRVDVEDERGDPQPTASWAIYAVHGNSMPQSYTLYHGDIQGLAARLTAAAIERQRGVRHFVAATANGAEGDVGPSAHPGEDQGKGKTRAVAEEVAKAAVRAFDHLDATIKNRDSHDAPITVAFAETSMRGAGTTRGRLCPEAFLGGPQLRGSEEGRGVPGFLAPILRTDEGLVDPPRGCVATKVRPLGGLQTWIVQGDELPDVLPFQVLVLGPPEGTPAHRAVALAAVPGEPTTEVGRSIERAVETALGWGRDKNVAALEDAERKTAVLGLTNGYATYFTTGPEYLAQAYEGGATLYGGHQGTFAVEELARLGARIAQSWKAQRQTAVLDLGFDATRTFRPGQQIDLLPTGGARCTPASWAPLGLEVRRPITTFRWRGAAPEEQCALPRIRIECGGQVLRGEDGLLQTDDGVALEVRQAGEVWSADWTVPGSSAANCVFIVDQPGDVRSAPFDLPVAR